MSENPYDPPVGAGERSSLLKPLVRVALYATYPFLAISVLTLMGLSIGTAFVTGFTVENCTDDPLYMTPIGTVGEQGDRHPLPIVMWPCPVLFSSNRGGFAVPPGDSIDLLYNWDDINFSEIVVHSSEGELGQLVVNDKPTENQYRRPAQTHFVIEDTQSLTPVPETVRTAVRAAQVPTRGPWIILSVLFLPWIANFGLLWIRRRMGRSSA